MPRPAPKLPDSPSPDTRPRSPTPSPSPSSRAPASPEAKANARTPVRIELPEKFGCLALPSRYKVFHGGRGGAKSWSIALVLILRAWKEPIRVLCAREFHTSIADSVHKLLSDTILRLDLGPWFRVTRVGIYSTAGAEFQFKGLKVNVGGVKSMEGVDICWVEEAQNVSLESWLALRPTIRKAGSQIWVSFNPINADDPTYKNFVLNPPPDSFCIQVNWYDNPHFPKELEAERRHMEQTDPDNYDHVWNGAPLKISEAIIFRRRVVVKNFVTPENVDRFFFGVDWGFANDPTVMVRSFIVGNTLYIDHEAFEYQTEIDEYARLFDQVPGSRVWPIKADNARPESISYMARQGFNISAAAKWQGSVEDGVAHLKGFDAIVIHERCKHMAQEARLYSYKVDRLGEILPTIVDKNNHGWDAMRYALSDFIRARGGLGVWERLASEDI